MGHSYSYKMKIGHNYKLLVTHVIKANKFYSIVYFTHKQHSIVIMIIITFFSMLCIFGGTDLGPSAY